MASDVHRCMKFKEVVTSTEVIPCSWRPSTATTDTNLEDLRVGINKDIARDGDHVEYHFLKTKSFSTNVQFQ